MRWKAFASQDFLNATPDILMNVEDCCKILHLLTTRMDTPEWTSASLNVTPDMLQQTAGMIGGHSPGGGYRPGENAGVTLEPALGHRQRLVPGAERKREAAEEEREGPLPERCPLGGWPRLSQGSQPAPMPSPLEERAYLPSELQLVAGAHVRLTGLQSKNGMTGVVQQHFPDSKGGKWKVSLDDNQGSAQLKECYLQVIAPPDPDWREKAAADTAELRAARRAKIAGISRASAKATAA
mmetsp:Transcript_97874/g.272408  ORF Transcript_97874/g.272408 Transcript_97874/m.272408 type:complete len:239 (-) Transcript_97874:102-818(-)